MLNWQDELATIEDKFSAMFGRGTDGPPLSAESSTAVEVPCEVWSRIVGYLRPVSNWNAGKQQEFAERETFDSVAEEVLNEHTAVWEELARK